jgi:hypothetical protein
MVFEKVCISSLPAGVTPVDYAGYWQEIEETEFISKGKAVIGQLQFEDLYALLKQQKTPFIFYTKTPEYAIRITFPHE